MSPAKLQSLLQSAVAHHRAGRLTEAESLYRQLRAVAPKHFDVLHLSGLVALQQSRPADAVEFLTRAHALDRKSTVCELRLGVALIAAGRPAAAEAHLRHVVAAQPDHVEAWDKLAYVLKTQDRLAEAVACHARVAALKPDDANGWCNYGLTLSLCGHSDQALQCHDRALAADPGLADARFGRAQALQQLDRLAEAVEEYGRVLAARPQYHEARSYRLLALHSLEEVSRENLWQEHQEYGRRVGGAPARAWTQAPDPGRRLRLAILSPDLRMHSCAYFLLPLLEHLDRSAFELCLYHDHFREDAVTARLRSLAAVWRNFVGQPESAVEPIIRADAPDILIDLAGHTGMTSRLPLLARRLAPVQVTYLGYPNTTGVPAMDYRFTDAVADPGDEADRLAAEKLVRFAPTAWTYQPPPDAPEAAGLPYATRGHVTFGCFNSPSKITDGMLARWKDLLEAVPGSRLRLKGQGLGEAGPRARYAERFSRVGLPADRVDLIERTPDTRSHLAHYREVDIALDTFPYHGTTTTCEALWMGVPVVSLAGDRHASRVGVSLLTAIGRPQWVASTPEDYLRIARDLAGNPAALTEEARTLRDRVRQSPLGDHAGQARRFAEALRQCWSEWCAAHGRTPPPAG
jgi:protein O-GlcNAc transferase